MVAVVAVAYGSAAPQLGVAEFAPAARSQVEPPPTTAGDQPASDSGRSSWRATTTTAPAASASTAPDARGGAAPSTTRVGRSRPCHGDPPRQTEDPLSPACVATIFEGDNGGGTSRGVSETEIRVGVLTSITPERVATVNALFEYVNQRFELYGRRLVPVLVSGTVSDPVAARAVVADLASQGVFAALTGIIELANSHVALPAELARQDVVTVTRAVGMGWSDRTLYDALHPHVWSVFPSAEDVQANLAEFACRALAGGEARFAGDVELRTKPRRYGVVVSAEVTAPQSSVLTQALAACTGVEPVVGQALGNGSASARVAIERMRAQGVTTMFCVCEDDYTYWAYSAAGGLGFHPEWVTTPDTARTNCANECTVQEFRRAGTLPPVMRLDAGPRALPMQARPWFGPIAPLLSGVSGSIAGYLGVAELAYPSLMVLAAGIQGAGPDLTPESFAQALMTTQFPNPGAGRPPYWQGGVGFGPGDHSFYDDYSIAWWSDDADALEQAQNAQPKGSWCYVDQAARFRIGSYPADLATKLFDRDLPCR